MFEAAAVPIRSHAMIRAPLRLLVLVCDGVMIDSEAAAQGVSPEARLVVEGSDGGVQSAQAAGTACVVLRGQDDAPPPTAALSAILITSVRPERLA